MNKTQKKIIFVLFAGFLLTSILPNILAQECSQSIKEKDQVSLLSTYHYRIFYIGQVENVFRTNNLVEFDAISLLRYTHMFATDRSFWSFSIAHYEETHHSHDDYRFIGILTESIICGLFTKSV